MLADIQDFLFSLLDIDLLTTWGMRLWLGIIMTFKLVIISCSIGFVLAYPICIARMSKNVILQGLARGYISIFRGTPLLCQLYLCYYGAGELRVQLTDAGMWWFFREAFYCCIVAFSMNTAAYQAEIMRGALMSVSKGQAEAATALGLSKYRIARHVVFPQAMLVALRPFSNELIGMIKASALSAIVTLFDLMGQTRFVFARTFDFGVYLYCSVVYLMMTETIRRVCLRLERALSRHKLAAIRSSVTEAVNRVTTPAGEGMLEPQTTR
jgi:polar amino acid transport system permease protein